MPESVSFTLQDKFCLVPWQKYDGVDGMNVFVIVLCVNCSNAFTRMRVITDQCFVCLVSVELNHIEGLVIRTPCNIREVSIRRVASLQINSFSTFYIIYSYSNLMTGLTCHGIFLRSKSSYPRVDIHFRIVCHHRLVHAIERQFLSVVAPECSFVDSEFITMYALTIYNITATVGCYLCGFTL